LALRGERKPTWGGKENFLKKRVKAAGGEDNYKTVGGGRNKRKK